jgi:hypothetical protein
MGQDVFSDGNTNICQRVMDLQGVEKIYISKNNGVDPV